MALKALPAGESYPLSPLQQGMLFHCIRDPETSMYVQQAAFAIDGLDVALFRQTWEKVVERHAVLRTSFHWDGLESPMQQVHEQVALPLEEQDWRNLLPDEQEIRWHSLLQADRQRRFVLDQAPLIRLTLIRLTDDSYSFIWSHHHLLLDGWSAPLLFRGVRAIYRALANGKELSLPPVRPYRDYITWLQEQDLGKAEAFWRRQLKGFTAPTPVPWDRLGGRRGGKKERPEKNQLMLPAELASGLQALVRQHQLTLNTLVQGAWSLVLSRYSGQADVLFGTTVSGRPPALEGIESMVGLFINTLPVRVPVPAEATLLTWLKNLQAQQAELRQYEYSPLVQVHGWSDVPRGTPLFQTLVVFENFPMGESSAPREGGLKIRRLHQAVEHTNFPLMLMAVPKPEGLQLEIVFPSQRLEPGAPARLLEQLQAVLQSMVANPEQQLAEVSMLTEAERQLVVKDWNNTAIAYPLERCLHEMIEDQVERTPDAVALVFEGERLKYRELNRRANQLAHHLRSLGVGPDVPVALCVERSLEMVVGLLGVLKAGGAYVPLDPSYPPERLAFMLQDMQAPVLLTQERLLGRLAPHQSRVLCLDRDWPTVAQEKDDNPQSGAQPHHLAYIIYTSGSTGQPKGAMNVHRGICNRLLWMQDAYQLTSADRILQKTPFSFDVSVWEFFWPLLTGARLVVAKPGGHQDGAYLTQLIASEGITTLHFVPSMLSVFLEEKDLTGCQCLRRVICSGEALPYELQEKFFSRLGAELHNLYGPTEASVDVTYWACERQSERKLVPIGRPIANIQMHVLDAQLRPLPIGVAGELHIGGIGLARGYWNRPELTEAKFIPDPFSSEPGARLYKTGDLARWLPDGVIEYLGRIDHQVKIRGFRIELGEIESVLGQHPAVRESVVVVRDDLPGGKGLVGYLVVNQDARPAVAQLREHLKGKLPEYMVPVAFVFLQALPISPNGKLDRRALPAPNFRQPDQERAYVAPRTPAEQTLAGIWARVLRQDKVGLHDNFFELGGDSILSIQVVARAGKAGLRLTPKLLFEHPTVSSLAAATLTAGPALAEQGAVTGPVPLTPIQHWFFEQNLVDGRHFNQATLLSVRQPVDVDVLERALGQLVEQHDALRLRFLHDEDGWRQVSAKPEAAPIALQRFDLSTLAEQEQGPALEKAAAEVQASLNLTEGPLIRAAYFNRGDSRPGRLLLAIHHLAVDAVSWRPLLEDLAATYRQLRAGQAEVRLPLKTSSFKQWAEHLLEHARSKALESERAYWLDLARSNVPRLPVDHPGGLNTRGVSDSIVVTLSEEETKALLQEVPQVYQTRINDALLAALAQAFEKWTGQRRLLVELEGHGREEIGGTELDLSRTVGWFTSIFPVHLDLGEATGPGEALQTVKEQLRGIPGKGIGYGLLRYLSGDEALKAQLRALPQAEVLFNYLGQTGGDGKEAGVLSAVRELSGPVLSLRGQRAHLLEINSSVQHGQLRLRWWFSTALHERATILKVAGAFIAALQGLIAHCRSPELGSFSPADFPLARLHQADLDKLTSQVLAGTGGSGTRSARREIEDVYDLSPLQQGLLFHSLRDPDAGMYFLQTVNPMTDLDSAAFLKAWQRVVDRHTILRTSFHWEGLDRPVQVVHRQIQIPVTERDWRGLAPGEQERRLQNFLQADRQRGFDLTQAPLIRLALIRMSEDSWYYAFSHHHLLLDGWSNPLLFRDLLGTYQALRRGQDLAQPSVRPYRDYIAWLHEQDLAKAEAFWRRHLRGFTTPTPLPVDQPASAGLNKKNHPEELKVILPAGLTADLRTLARQRQLTLNVLVQGAWALLLSRHSGQDDVVFGATVSGRPPDLEGVESMVGLFINSLPIRVAVPASEHLLSWLKKLQVYQAELMQFEYSPLAQVKRWSEVPRDTPLFESLLAFENYPGNRSLKPPKTPGTRQAHHVVQQTSHPLTMVVVPQEEALLLKIIYASGLFEAATVARMLEHFQAILESFVARPDQRLAQVSMLSQQERQRLLVDWNFTQADFPCDTCVHQLFEQRATERPTALAVTFQDQEITYEDLQRRVDDLARRLARWHVGPGVLVGVCLPRSPEAVVAFLGVLKAGAAYLPLDPNLPTERQALVLNDAKVRVLLTRQSLREGLPSGDWITQCLDGDWRAPAAAANGAAGTNGAAKVSGTAEVNGVAGPRVTPADLAYVIYTSGSTGRPKGVLVEHRGLTNLIVSQVKTYDVRPDSRILQFASLAFDASVAEMLRALTSGACLCLAPAEDLLPGPGLIQLLQDRGVTHVTLSPSVLAALPAADLPALRAIIVGGEACPAELVARWAPGRRFFNGYGPTETTVCATVTQCQVDDRKPSIGRPLPNTQVYILNEHLQPVPVSVPGELHIGGVQVARGYLNRPDLTAAKFISNPFSTEPGTRLYKTGDLVRWLPDGNLDFLGRIDQQVKLRGFRIELGEIESVLTQHEGVRENAVVVRDDLPGGKGLVAYVVARQEPGPKATDLRNYLKSKLPEYMVPAAFVFLPSLPLTVQGKLDRRALPAPNLRPSDLEKTYVAPRGAAEQLLAQIWSKVLRVERVGRDDNFFELGGDSILSIQIVARALKAGLALTPKLLFQHPTIAGLAEAAKSVKSVEADQGLATGPVPLTPIQHWFFEQDLSNPHHFNQVMLFEVHQTLNLDKLERALRILGEHHDALRLRYLREEGGWRQINAGAEAADVPLERVDLSGKSAEELRPALVEAAQKAQSNLNLTEGPLARAVHFHRGAGQTAWLLLVVHHLAVDAVSWRSLREDLITAYQQLAAHEEVRLPLKTTSFKQWAERLVDHARSAALEPERAYWLNPVRAEVRSIPLDHPDGANTRASAQSLMVMLSPEETSALLQEVPRAYRTQINDVLLTALVQAFERWTGERYLLVDLEGHGREEIPGSPLDLSRTVGWFTSMFPVFLDLGKASAPGDALQSIRDQLRAIPNRGIGYGLLRYLGDDELRAQLRALPRAEVSFNYLGQADKVGERSDLLTPAQEPTGPAFSREGMRNRPLMVNVNVVGGRLRARWTYSSNLHERATIERLANDFLQALQALIAHCQAPQGSGFTPADFPAARVDQEDLDRLLAQIG